MFNPQTCIYPGEAVSADVQFVLHQLSLREGEDRESLMSCITSHCMMNELEITNKIRQLPSSPSSSTHCSEIRLC